MVSARTGGLAVALGLGYAVAAGAGVASADTTEGSGGTDTSTSSEAGASASTATKSTEPSDPSPQTSPTKEAASGSDGDESDDPSRAERSRKSRASAADDEPATSEKAPATTARESVADQEAEPSEKAADDQPATKIEMTSAKTEPAQPAEPADVPETLPNSLALLSAATAAAARETATAEPQQSSSLVSPAAAPSVVAIEQIPPLGFLQQIPVFGSALVTPVVAVLHQIPVVGDILHPFVGYPVQWGLPPGAPRPRDVKVVSFDGTQIYVHFMPASGLVQGGRAPTVLNGPGLGLPGATNLDGTFLDPILADAVGMLSPGTLRRAGYNVVTWDPRGEWNSGGILELNADEFEGRDMSAIIDWIATQPEVALDSPGDPRLGMMGVSYGGGIQLVTAARDTRVDAIVPAITYNRLDTSLYKSAAFKSSWATPLVAVLQVLGGRINPRVLPAAIYGDITGELQPDDLALFLSRNPDIEKITVPTLLIHGTVDTLFSLAEADATATTLLANGVTTKVVWFCGGHGVCANNLFDLSDGVLIERRTIEWLDEYVKADPNITVDTGPQFEWVDQRGQWYSSSTYPVAQGSALVGSIDGERTLPLIPYVGGSGLPFIPYALPAAGNAVSLTIPAGSTTAYLVGAPKLTLTYSGTGSASHIYAQLVDDRTGMVLGSLVTPVPVTLDGDSRRITIDLEPVAHTLRPGETVTLQLVSSAGLYETIVPSFGTLTVTGLQVTVPTANPNVAVVQAS